MAFKVVYDPNGATGITPVDMNTYGVDDTVTVMYPDQLVMGGAFFHYWAATKDDGNPTFGLDPQGKLQTLKLSDITQDTTATIVKLYAQWYTKVGIDTMIVTPHYDFSYHIALQKSDANPSGLEPARTNLVVKDCENDYDMMSKWFGCGLSLEGTLHIPIKVYVRENTNAGLGAQGGSDISLRPRSHHAVFCRYLIVSEVTEFFMDTQSLGWSSINDVNESLRGEALSRFLAEQFLVESKLGLAQDWLADFSLSNSWLNSSLIPVRNIHGLIVGDPRSTRLRHNGADLIYDYGARYDYLDFVSGSATWSIENDVQIDPATGCCMLFLYYLHTQLGFDVNSIIAAAPFSDPTTNRSKPSMKSVYRNLTKSDNDPFPFFNQLLTQAFPPDRVSRIPGSNPDDPWPLPVAAGPPSAIVKSLRLSPPTVIGGSVTEAEFVLAAPVGAAGGYVSVYSSDPSVATVPEMVHLLPYAASGHFVIHTKALHPPIHKKLCTITVAQTGALAHALLTVTS